MSGKRSVKTKKRVQERKRMGQLHDRRSTSTGGIMLLAVILGGFTMDTASARDPILKAGPSISVPGTSGYFDFMEVDPVQDRLLAAHTGGGSLALVDLKTGRLLPALPVRNVQGVAVDPSSGTYILGDAQEHKVVFVNSRTLKVLGELPVSGPVDALAFDSRNGMVYAGEDDGSHVWVIDVKSRKLVATVGISGVPESVVFDSATDRIYQNLKTVDAVEVIDSASQTVSSNWSTLPAIDLKSGKVVAHADIAPGTDPISFDPTDKMIYCASRGVISVVRETSAGLESLETVPVHAGTHTLASVPGRHQVWISFGDQKGSSLQKFTVSPSHGKEELK